MHKIDSPKFDWSRFDGRDLGHSENELGIQQKSKNPIIIEAYTVKFLKSN